MTSDWDLELNARFIEAKIRTSGLPEGAIDRIINALRIEVSDEIEDRERKSAFGGGGKGN